MKAIQLRNKIIQRLLLLYILLQPYYIFGSGGIQIADVLLFGAFVLYFVTSRLKNEFRKSMNDSISFNTYLIVYIFIVFIINLIYFLYFKEVKFLLSTLYFVFNLFAVLLFTDLGKDKSFIRKISLMLQFNIGIQLLINILGVGRNYDPIRYMGTFNDPNQFAFNVLISYLLIYVIQTVLKQKYYDKVLLFIVTYLIFLSGSTGNLLGIAVFLLLRIGYVLLHDHRITLARLRALFISLSVGIIIVLATILLSGPGTVHKLGANANNVFKSQSIVSRINDKVSGSTSSSHRSLLEDRGIDIIYKYPKYILFGAGEGGYTRYTKAVNNYGLEIHSTFLSMFFYYGFIPFFILLKWFYKNIKGVETKVLIALVALIAESFTLLNQRQSLFWVIFVIGGMYAVKQVKTSKHQVAK